MRVNPNYTTDMVNLIEASQQNEATAVEQLSTGRRVNNPSDDPAADAAMVAENTQTADCDQFTANSESLQTLLNTADSTLSSVVTALQRASTLAVEAANGSMNQSDLNSILTEVTGIKSQVLSLANTSYAGNYIFAGTATSTEPYVVDSSNPDQIDYVGNNQQNKIQIGTGLTVSGNLPGSSLFSQGSGNVFDALQSLESALQSGDSTTITSAETQITSALNALDSSRVFYGNTVNELTANESYLSQEKLNITSRENDLVSADPAQAATNSSQAQLDLTATVEAVANMEQQANLLNYIH